LIEGSANIRELNKAFNWTLPEVEARTVNGMILEALQDIPLANTTVQIGHYAVDILDVQDNMIKQVRITPQTSLKESVGSS